MSYPGPVGVVTNLGCDTGLQRSSDQFNFVLDNGSGASSSNLLSPASVIPSGGGSATLTVANAAGGAPALVQVIDTVGNLAEVAIVCQPAGAAVVNLGLNTNPVALVSRGSEPGVLRVSNNNSGLTTMIMDTVANSVALADAGSTGNIRLNGNTFITEFGSSPNSLGLGPLTATTSSIRQYIAGGGTVSVGSSSVANAQETLQVIDDGTFGSVQVTGGGGTGKLFLSGGGVVGTNQIATIQTFPPDANNLLNLGATNVNPGYKALQITPTNMIANVPLNLTSPPAITTGYAPVVLKAAGASSGIFELSLSTLADGWSLVYGYSATPAAADRAAMFQVMVYKSGNVVLGGGIGGVPAQVLVQPSNTTSSALTINIANATSANYQILGITMLSG